MALSLEPDPGGDRDRVGTNLPEVMVGERRWDILRDG
jgi:hypothetical protein